MNCKNCGEPIKKYNKFCSMHCSAVFNNKIRKQSDYSVKFKNKTIKCSNCNLDINVPINTNNEDILCKLCKTLRYFIHNKICTRCGSYFDVKYKTNTKHERKYCNSCLFDINKQSASKGGLKSVTIQSLNKRSKNEAYFAELCRQKFKFIKINEPIFDGWDADVIIEDFKIAILWNGKWHYEKLKRLHSVEQVQNRDKIKLEKIKNCGYNSYVIKDLGKYNSKFVEEQFKILCEFLGV